MGPTRVGTCVFLLISLILSACGKQASSTSAVASCPAITGTAWTPTVTGVASTNHDTSAAFSVTTQTATGSIIGVGQGITPTIEVSFTIDRTVDLGANGSITLEAEVTEKPATVEGDVFPVLTYLSDGTYDWINLARAGTGGDCAQTGLYSCSNGSCTTNDSCSLTWPSAYGNRDQWEQHQIPTFGAASINTFPTCNWTSGTTATVSDPACAFNTHYFPAALTPKRLPFGGTYTAKYALVAGGYSTVTSGSTGTVRLRVVQKTKAANSTSAIDLNLVLVGSNNVNASRTAKGKQNLDLLLQAVYDHYSQSNVTTKIGRINVIEWPCESGGAAYAAVKASQLSQLFQEGSRSFTSIYDSGAGATGKPGALNLFLVSTIGDDFSGNSNLTVLGIAGGIGGPLGNATLSSGLAFSSFDKLDSYNPSCTSSSCPLSSQEAAFVDMGATISHEIGHYLGLNHPTESSGSLHDLIRDTPICTTTDSSLGYITSRMCAVNDNNVFAPTGQKCKDVCPGYSRTAGIFCPAQLECQFNHLMWWTSKGFKAGNGDGNIFSSQTGQIINYHPFVY